MPLLPTDPTQRKILMVGVPVAAALAIGTIVKGNQEPAEDPEIPENGATPGTAGFVMPSTDAIGTGELGQFESNVTDYLLQLQQSLDQAVTRAQTTIPGAGTTTSGGSSSTTTSSTPPGDMVEAVLRRIVNANPKLKGRTTCPAGFALRVPKPDGTIAIHRIA